MNKVILMGRLTKNPEIKYAGKDNDMAVARYTLAVNRRYKCDGEQEADFISCVTFGKSAEFAQKYLYKGMRIVIGGRISTGFCASSVDCLLVLLDRPLLCPLPKPQVPSEPPILPLSLAVGNCSASVPCKA